MRINMQMRETHQGCEEKQEGARYQIGMFAAMNHVTVKALRFYEEQGLLIPVYVDEESGYRYYTMAQMADMQQILAWKEAGFKLDEIRELRRQENKESVLLKKKNEILEEIANLTAKLAKLESFLNGESILFDMPIRLRRIPEVTVAFMRRRIESYDALFDLMPEMGAQMELAGCRCALPEYCFVNYPESGYKAEQILVEACEAVTEKGKDTEKLQFRTYPEIEAVCAFHKGSYRDLPRAYGAVLQYIEKNGYEICGDIREKYIDGVWNKDSEKEWLTEIQVPVRKLA